MTTDFTIDTCIVSSARLNFFFLLQEQAPTAPQEESAPKIETAAETSTPPSRSQTLLAASTPSPSEDCRIGLSFLFFVVLIKNGTLTRTFQMGRRTG